MISLVLGIVGEFLSKFSVPSISTVQHAVARRITAKLLLAAWHLVISLHYLVLVLQEMGNSSSSKYTYSHDVIHFLMSVAQWSLLQTEGF